MNGNKANAHAGMLFCGVSRFVVTGFSTGSWSYRPRATARLGRGSVCVYRSLGMLSLKVVNATIYAFFCIHTKFGEVHC